jgi:hypothetical protein
MDEKNIKSTDCRLHEYRLNELTDDVKEVKADVKELRNQVDERFASMTEVLLKSQNDMFEKMLKNEEIKQSGKNNKSTNRTNVVTAAIAGTISIIIAILSKFII